MLCSSGHKQAWGCILHLSHHHMSLRIHKTLAWGSSVQRELIPGGIRQLIICGQTAAWLLQL